MNKTTETVTITDFLLARIAEDEAVAEEYIMEFGGVWSPERILAECEAKERIVVELHKVHGYGRGSCDTCTDMDYVGLVDVGPCDTLRTLASVYADHPDYRDEWKL